MSYLDADFISAREWQKTIFKPYAVEDIKEFGKEQGGEGGGTEEDADKMQE